MTMIITRYSGRKRKDRTAHLRAEAAHKLQTDRELSALQPHRRGLPEALRLDWKAENELGRLNLRAVISDEQHEAGRQWKIVVGNYLASIDAQRGRGGGGRGYPCQGSPICGQLKELPPCECRARKRKYDDALHALADAGHASCVIVSKVAIYDEYCPSDAIQALQRGLNCLVVQLGIDKPQKKRDSRNASFGSAPAR